MSNKYKISAIRQLSAEQIERTPLDERLDQIDRAEKLLSRIVPDQTYNYRDLYRQITAKRPYGKPDLTVKGGDALNDLRLFVEDVSDSADLPADDAGEPVFTVEDLSRRFNVSTKTVERWRQRGLASRRFLFGSRKRIGFLKSTVDRFVENHGEEIDRGARFSQMTETERQEIVHSAGILARGGASPAVVVRHLAREFGRSPEAVRYTIRNHDRENPDMAIFPQPTSVLSEEIKQDVYRRFRKGATAEQLAGQFGRSTASVSRIINLMRARELMEKPIEFVYNKEFERRKAEAVILGPAPETPRQKLFKAPPGLPPYLASLYDFPLLTREQEAYYFRKMNYLKFRAGRLREELDPARPSVRLMDEIEAFMKQAEEVKNLLIRRNLRLVVSIARKYVKAGANFFEMVSDGNVSLMRAIEKFDYSRGFKLSTYATWAIRKNFARSIPSEHTQLSRFRTGNDELFHDSHDDKTSLYEQEVRHERQHDALVQILKRLDERERNILVTRYGLKQGTEPQTLEQVGAVFGVTKERIRQLEARALRKLREFADEEKLDIPGIA